MSRSRAVARPTMPPPTITMSYHCWAIVKIPPSSEGMVPEWRVERERGEPDVDQDGWPLVSAVEWGRRAGVCHTYPPVPKMPKCQNWLCGWAFRSEPGPGAAADEGRPGAA